MTITGTITDKDGTLPSANVYVSDKQGNPLQPLIGTSSSVVDGSYTLNDVPQDAYVTTSYVGLKKNTVQINGNAKQDFLLVPDSAEIPAFEFVADAFTPKKINKTLMYIGIGIGVVVLVYVLYRVFIKK